MGSFFSFLKMQPEPCQFEEKSTTSTEFDTASSTSLNSLSDQWKYDVFISFRGEDTRKTFTSHLYEGLKHSGICTFQDDKRLEYGDSIPDELLKAIEESQVAIVVFSKNFATSSWCLDELVKITECKDKNGQIVIPVFYDVDPSHVRKQKKSFAEAFKTHESKYKGDVEGMQKVKAWRTAVTAVADRSGCDVRGKIESDCVRNVIDQVSSKLCKTSLSYLQDIVGINTHLKKVTPLLKMEINDVRIVGIWGMGGVGKTTIARAIFDTLSSEFDDACFLADIKENKHGMHYLQNILLSELLRKKENYVNNKEDGKHMIAHRLRFKKVLVVLDDIDHEDHLDYLAGDLGWYGNGSRIIATTRDKHFIGKNDVVYKVTTLLQSDAIQLFNKYAFKEEAQDECFEELASEVVSHAKGLPLALKVWGSFLHKRGITEWRSAVDRIKKNTGKKIVENLKISYDGLEHEEQEIFLDIACFLRGVNKDEVTKILESCDFKVGIGLHVLIDKSLVFISEKNTIEMHDLIQEMGKYVVNKDPTKRSSRLWNAEDFKEAMVNNTGIMAMEALWFTCSFHNQICFNKEAMQNMKMLRILNISMRGSILLNGSIGYLSNNLRWVVWHFYPWVSLPEKFEPQRLVHLNLRWSLLHDLWTKRKDLRYLRDLDLSYSCRLMRTPDFTGMPNLEYLNLHECTSLEEVHPSLRYCKKLIQLDLSYCEKLKELPGFMGMPNLETLNLSYCNLIDGGLPEDIGCLSSLKELDLSANNFEHLPRSITQLGALRFLNLSYCKRLTQLPKFPEQLDQICAYWSNDSICNLLFQNISSLQHDFSAPDSLSLRVFTSRTVDWWKAMSTIPSWFRFRGTGTSVLVNLPENWYVTDNFLGFAVCCCKLIDTTVDLIPLCDDGMSWMTQKLALPNHSKYDIAFSIHFFLVPFAGLWDTSKANGKTPND